MKTKKVLISRASAAFSTATPVNTTVTLPRAPWDQEPDYVKPEAVPDEPRRREPRHIGPYAKRDPS